VHEEQNYGRSREPGDGMGDPGGDPFDGTEGPTGSTMSPQDEQMWSVIAHLSMLANVITLGVPIVGPFITLFIWLALRDRSQRVAFHALQSLWYQLAWLAILIIGWFLAMILVIVLIGLLLLPVVFVIPLVPTIHMGYAAYKVSQGVDYRYPFIADRIDGGARRML
jgi:uncharacterized Tic20 family protein